MQSVFLPVITTEGGTLMTKGYEELTFADDFMFCRVLEDSPGLCRELLSLILDRPVGELVSVNRQKPIEIKADSKGVRFDIYAEGDDSTIYNVEMQNASVDNIAKRASYAQGMLDLNLLDRGAKYKDLNRSYVIYICQFNINETAASAFCLIINVHITLLVSYWYRLSGHHRSLPVSLPSCQS